MPGLRDRFYRWISWSPLLFLAGLAALTYWLDTQVKMPEDRQQKQVRHQPDLFIDDFSATQFDVQGLPQQQLAARHAEHFADDDSIALDAPHITLHKPEQPRITIVSRSAQISGDRQNVYFRGNVVAVRDAPPATSTDGLPNEKMTLRTDYLLLRPDDNTLSTDQAISLDSASGRIEAVGMDLDRNTTTIQLHSQVRGSFQPASPQPSP